MARRTRARKNGGIELKIWKKGERFEPAKLKQQAAWAYSESRCQPQGHSCYWSVEFAKRSVRGRVSNLLVGITGAQALSLIVNPMPPRITEKSYRPRVSDRTMVATCRCNRFACCFRNRIALELLLSLFVERLRTVLAVKGSLRLAETARP